MQSKCWPSNAYDTRPGKRGEQQSSGRLKDGTGRMPGKTRPYAMGARLGLLGLGEPHAQGERAPNVERGRLSRRVSGSELTPGCGLAAAESSKCV